MSKREKMVKGGLVFALLFCLFFGLLFQFVNDTYFDSDEGDIFSRGAAIVMGYDLYSEISSQHMPFTYYFSALFWALGAQSITAQRIAFYIFFAVLWCVIYFRYKSDVGKAALIAYPVMFTFAVCLYEMGTAILSEHLAGIGFVILALEFLRFCKKRTIERDSCIAISFAIVLTFGTIFIAAYGVATVAVFVLVKEVQWLISEHQSFKHWLKNVALLFLKLAFWCLLPWVVLVVIYAINGNLEDAFYYAYTFNRTVYAKYTGGYGADAIEGALSGLTYLKNMVTGFLGGNLSLVSWAEIIVCCLALMGIVWQAMKRHVTEALFFGVLVVALATRGIWTFHGTQCVAMLCFLAAMTIGFIVRELKQGVLHAVIGTALVVCIGIVSMTYCSNFAINIETSEGKTVDAQILDVITEDGEGILSCGGGANKNLIQSKNVSIKGMGTPWFADVRAEEIMTDYPNGMTKVAVFDRTIAVWSRKITDYAPELCAYIEKNYTKLYSDIHVRNDEYEEACASLEANNIPFFSFAEESEEGKLIITLTRNSEENQGVSMAVWSANAGQDDLVWYDAKPNEDGKYVVEVNLANHLLDAQEGKIYVHVYDSNGWVVGDWYYAILTTP